MTTKKIEITKIKNEKFTPHLQNLVVVVVSMSFFLLINPQKHFQSRLSFAY